MADPLWNECAKVGDDPGMLTIPNAMPRLAVLLT